MIRNTFRFFGGVLIAASFMISLPWLIASAHADTSPIVTAASSGDAIFQIVQTYGWLWGGLTLLYIGVGWLLKLNQSTHWIAQGKRLAMATSVVGVVGSALQAYFGGTPLTGVIATAALGALHLADAQVTPTAVGGGK